MHEGIPTEETLPVESSDGTLLEATPPMYDTQESERINHDNNIEDVVIPKNQEQEGMEKKLLFLRSLIANASQQRNNKENLRNAAMIAQISREEIAQLSANERRALLSGISWDTWEGFSSGTHQDAPEEIYDAEARIYETYTPSEALLQKHTDAFDAVLKQHTPEELWKMSARWDNMDTTAKKEYLTEWSRQISSAYGFPELLTVVGPMESEVERDMLMGFAPGHQYQKNVVGGLLIPEQSLGRDLHTLLESVRHELAHGYQRAAILGLIPPIDIDAISEDVEWFTLNEDRDRVRNRNKYQGSTWRYEAMPWEQDAFRAQRDGSAKISNMLHQHRDLILANAGLESYEILEKKESVARWIEKQYVANPSISREEIIRIASESLPTRGVERIEALFASYPTAYIHQIIQNVYFDNKHADELLQSEKGKARLE